jgi:hypothetical protein
MEQIKRRSCSPFWALLSILSQRPRGSGAASLLKRRRPFPQPNNKEAIMADTNFVQTIEALAAGMKKSAAHLASHLKAIETSHAAFGVLHRLERVLYDCSTHIDGSLAQLSPEMRAKLTEGEERD